MDNVSHRWNQGGDVLSPQIKNQRSRRKRDTARGCNARSLETKAEPPAWARTISKGGGSGGLGRGAGWGKM